MAALGLDMLLAPSWWARLVTAIARSTVSEEFASELTGSCARLEMIVTGFPALAAMIGTPDLAASGDRDSLVVMVSGHDGQKPSLPRIAAALAAMDQLWSVSEDLTGQRGPLQLLGIEPGQPVCLHLDGLAEPLQELRQLLVSVADLVASAHHIPQDQHAAVLAGKLPVMDRILRSGRADAVSVRTALETGVRSLLEAGCSVRRDLRAAQPVHAPRTAASGAATPAAAPTLAPLAPNTPPAQDFAYLADVIAEERRQLQRAEPGRHLWQSAAAATRGV